MTLQSSGNLSLSKIATEFGGGDRLSAFYAGGGHVPAGIGIPGSGTLHISDFYGKSNFLEQLSLGIGTDTVFYGYLDGFFGSISPNRPTTNLGLGIAALYWGPVSGGQLTFQLDGDNSDPSTTLIVNGNNYAFASASRPDGATWVWGTGNPIGTSGTIPVDFR